MVPQRELEQKAPGENHQGIIAFISFYRYYTSNELLRQGRLEGRILSFMLDHLQDPYNFGSLLRTASVTGVSEQ